MGAGQNCLRLALLTATSLLFLLAAGFAQGSTVTGRVVSTAADGSARGQAAASVVVWLTPLPARDAGGVRTAGEKPRRTLIQKSKRFRPRVMAVEVGSVVDFPNLDPFFHNVFSLFDGKRFDLGLYEAGATRSVRFDKPGVCYIFCNIHPEMSAVVIVVDSPYFAEARPSGEFEIPNTPPGRYRLNVWREHCLPHTLKELSREIIIGDDATAALGTIRMQECKETVKVRTNKYGKSYDPPVFSGPLYER